MQTVVVETIKAPSHMDQCMDVLNQTGRVRPTHRIQQGRNVYIRTSSRTGVTVWEQYRIGSDGIEMFQGYVTDMIRHAGLTALAK